MTRRYAIRCGAALMALAVASHAAPETTGSPNPLAAAAQQERYRLDFDGSHFSGPAWDLLLAEGRSAQFFLIGEQHGIAENALLAAALFEALADDGYEHVVIEISPPIAAELDRTLRLEGLAGLRALYALPGAEPAFFGMREEAEFIARARAAVAGRRPVLWGVDYEVGADRHLLRLLEGRRRPRAAADDYERLLEQSRESWNAYARTRDPRHMFSFAGDPVLVRALRERWPRPDAATAEILHTLEETLSINALWVSGDGFASNARRAALLRSNFLRYWEAAERARRVPKVMAKLGASHMVRGLNSNGTFDLGSLLPELAAAQGSHAFSMLVLAGEGSEVATLDPSSWTYGAGLPRDPYAGGLTPLTDGVFADAYTLIDLRPLRGSLPWREREALHPQLRRVLFGFDVLLVMTGSTPAAEFEHPAPPH